MEEKVITWKMGGFGKGIDAIIVHQELKRITDEKGLLTPEILVTEASSEDSILHMFFEWDKDKAAHNYNLQQARSLINNIQIRIIKTGQTKQVGAYEIVKVGNERSYKSVDSLSANDLAYIKKETLKSLSQIKDKLNLYEDFAETSKLILESIETLTNVDA